MKEYCSGTILFSTLAVGTGLILASNAMADTKGNASNPSQQGSSHHRINAAKTTSNTKRQMAKKEWGKLPEGGIAGGPINDDCIGRIPIFDGVTPYDTTGAVTDGPPHAACLFFGDNQVNQDIWYNYIATTDGNLTVALCGSSYDTKLAIYDGCACPVGDANLLACNDDFCSLQSQLATTVIAGNCYKIRVGGYGAAAGAGQVTITPGGVGGPCPNPDHDCFTTGTPGCSDEACCNLVCGFDPFCCATAWDGICVSEAIANCEGFKLPCPNPDHDCNTTGTPGCSDQGCCETICALDAFCCQVAWDGICVSEAAVFCAPPCVFECPPGAVQENEPCGSDTNGGCNSPVPVYTPIVCGDTVCGNQWAAGGTRDTDWYSFSIATDGTEVEWCVLSQFPSAVFILNSDCAAITLLGQGTGVCPTCASPTCGFLDAGNYVAFVAPAAFDGAPCGNGNNDYVATLTCTAPCLADITGNGFVNIDDLLAVINAWGPCP